MPKQQEEKETRNYYISYWNKTRKGGDDGTSYAGGSASTTATPGHHENPYTDESECQRGDRDGSSEGWVRDGDFPSPIHDTPPRHGPGQQPR